jgi:hypothetical protein
MELAGLACAQALATAYKKETHPRVLVCCGPGNQGMSLGYEESIRFIVSDLSVRGRWARSSASPRYVTTNSCNEQAAQHWFPGMFGYKPTLYMPKVHCISYPRRVQR